MTPLIRINTELFTRPLAAMLSVASGWHSHVCTHRNPQLLTDRAVENHHAYAKSTERQPTCSDTCGWSIHRKYMLLNELWQIRSVGQASFGIMSAMNRSYYYGA